MPRIIPQKPQRKESWLEEHGEALTTLAESIYRMDSGHLLQCQEEWIQDYLDEAYDQYCFDFSEAMVNRYE